MKQKLFPIYRFLASLKLAVILLLMLGAILAAATFYESIYDTKTAQHLVYRSPFFAAFLGLLFVNIFCSTTIRYPWKKHQFGFVVTHIGILILLLGSLTTMVAGVDGSLAVQVGKTGSRITLDEPVFFYGKSAERLDEIDAEFRWNPPREAAPSKFHLMDGVDVLVDRYLHHSQSEIRYEPDEKAGVGALKLRIHNKRVDVKEWLTLASGDLAMGPATVKFVRLVDEADVKSFLGQNWEAGDHGELQLLIDKDARRVSVRDLREGQWVAVHDTQYEVRLNRYLPHAVAENGKLISKSDEPVNPTLDLDIRRGEGNTQSWLVFAAMPELNTRTGSHGESLPVRMLYDWQPRAQNKRVLCLAVGPGNQLYSRIDNRAGQPVKLHEDLATGWMDLKYELLEFVPRGRQVKDFQAVEWEKGEEGEGPPPAIRVRFPGLAEPGPFWMERGDVIQVKRAPGDTFIFGYGYRSKEMGFNLELKDFHIDYDPGTRSPAAFRSTVGFNGVEQVIQMNEPLVKNGYKFFQASYSEINGEPKISVFTVARDPGIEMKYGGSILLVGGIIIMFYMKPYQLKNKSGRQGPDPLPSRPQENECED